MDYLTDHTGKLIDNTGAVSYLYNLLKEEVGECVLTVTNRTRRAGSFRISNLTQRPFPGRAKSNAAKMDRERFPESDERYSGVGFSTSIIHEDLE